MTFILLGLFLVVGLPAILMTWAAFCMIAGGVGTPSAIGVVALVATVLLFLIVKLFKK